ncbi:MAG: hypothetical protein HC933_09545 [Pleurocapsa sp. SU_196_0]|nr:hypothetical protein [Pleurocapsa sp. SU_196_0]
MPVAVANGLIYLPLSSGQLVAVNSSGAMVWTFPTGLTGIEAMSVSADGTAYLRSRTNLIAVSAAGALEWSSETNTPNWRDPRQCSCAPMGCWICSEDNLGTVTSFRLTGTGFSVG